MRRPIARDQNQRRRVPGSLVANWVNFFNPAELRPIVWLDASDTATITESGGSVSQWANKGSLGAFTQGTAAQQPTTGSETLNGYNVLSFSDDNLVSADVAAAYNDLHNGTPYIIAGISKMGTSSNPGTVYYFLGNISSSAQRGLFVDYDDVNLGRNNFIRHFVARGVSGSLVILNATDNVFTPNVMHAMSIYADPSNSVAANRSELFIDAATALKNNTVTNAVSALDAGFTMKIGSLGDGTARLTGSIAEIVIVTGSRATPANRLLLHNYLQRKWGL